MPKGHQRKPQNFNFQRTCTEEESPNNSSEKYITFVQTEASSTRYLCHQRYNFNSPILYDKKHIWKSLNAGIIQLSVMNNESI